MIKIILIAAALGFYSLCQAKDDQCFICHQVQDDSPSKQYAHDIHHSKGISCAGCHGGKSDTDDMEAAMNKSSGFIGIPKGDIKTEVCIKCHSNEKVMKTFGSSLPVNQFDLLKASVHGKISVSGNSRILQCTDCHKAHGIMPVNSPLSPVYPLNVPKTCAKCHSDAVYMRTYNPSLPTDQYQKYLISRHGKLNSKGDPKPAECVSCHGGHDISHVGDPNSRVYKIKLPYTCSGCHSNKEYMSGYDIPTNQFEKYSRSVHGKALLEKNLSGAPACNDCHGNHAATPPGVTSISQVCGTCHPLNLELFAGSPHKIAFDKNNYPECETCHGNHEIITAALSLTGESIRSACSKCHSSNKNSKGYLAAETMQLFWDSLYNSISNAKILIGEARQKGMEISEAEFKLRDVNQAVQEARTTIHSFNQDKFKEVVKDKGLKVTGEVLNEAKGAVHEYYFRRIGLAVSIGIMSLLAVALFFYIRQLDNKNKFH